MKKSGLYAILLLPVLLLTAGFIRSSHPELAGLRGIKRTGTYMANLLPLLLFVLFDARRHITSDLLKTSARSGYYCYLFMVLKLTLFLVPLKRFSFSYWKHHLDDRMHHSQGMNTTLFRIFHDYRDLWNEQIVGNFIMLLPLGIFLPVLYPAFNNFFKTIATAFLFSVSIELLQVLTDHRATDIDDVLLNTSGAIAGFLLFKTGLFNRFSHRPVLAGA